jgi:dienelactone hydrolase
MWFLRKVSCCIQALVTILIVGNMCAYTNASNFSRVQDAASAPKKARPIGREVTFSTEDKWTIHGVLTIPIDFQGKPKVPAIILIHAPVHDSAIFGNNPYPSLREALEDGTLATLRIDIRGRGKSDQPHEFHEFTAEQRSRVVLDVRAAANFLVTLKEIDPTKIGIVAEMGSADYALTEAMNDRRIRAMVMLSGRLGRAVKDLIPDRRDLPLLGVASEEDKGGIGDMTEAIKLSRNHYSKLMTFRDVGVGNSMFITWAAKFPKEKGLQITVGEWLIAQMWPTYEPREVSFQSEDGWMIYASLRVPKIDDSPNAPGVVLVHSNLSDRHVYDDLEVMLADAGIAVLNLDFRGRGKSHNKGYYFELPQPERDKAYLDAIAGLKFLASQPGVDANRLAVIGTAIGTRYAIKAALSNPRVKAFVMLGGLPEKSEVEGARFPIMFVSTLGVPPIAEAFRDFYKLAKDRRSKLVEHEGGALGYQIFEIDEELQPQIVRWLKPILVQKEN